MIPSQPSVCPTCHSPIPDDAPGGLCPACTLARAASVPHAGTGGRHTPPPSIETIAPHFPDLEVLELLGAGGMGAVYKARQPQLDRFVAVKILSHELAQDPAFVERFNREAKVLARLSHPNIVTIFDFGTAGPYCYLLMEHVDGVNLRQAMRTGGFKPAEALALVQEICSALQFAHEEGILHRDIKPENVLLDSKGRVKIADFGIAKMVGVGAASEVTLTLQGSILGTPHYMAPEQFETPGDVDQRADIYSLGVVLYEMLTGELPIGRFALPSEKAAMDSRIDEIVMRTLEKERERRYQTVGEMKTEFDGIGNATVPSQAAFINWNEEILDFSKYTFWIAMGFLVMLLIDVGPAFSGDADDLPDTLGFTYFLLGASIFLSTLSGILRAVYTIRTRGGLSGGIGHLPTRVHAPIRRDQGTAHLGLTGAILTGVSLLLAGATLYVANTPDDADLRLIVYVVGAGVDGTIAILGFILGAMALGEIRKSGGQKDGLGSAIFAVVTWPICIIGVLILFSLSKPMPGSGGSGIPTSLAVLLAGISLLFASFVLIRGLRRWARGAEKKDGQRHFPKLTGTVLATLGLAILGPVLAVVILTLFPASGSHDQFAEIEREMARVRSEAAQWEELATDTDSSEEVPWRLGKPEVTIPVVAQPGQQVHLRLILRNEGEQPLDFPLGEFKADSDTSPTRVQLKVGTFLKADELEGAIHALAAVRTGRDSRTKRTLTDLRGWTFASEFPKELSFATPGVREIGIATSGENEPADTKGVLSLEMSVTDAAPAGDRMESR